MQKNFRLKRIVDKRLGRRAGRSADLVSGAPFGRRTHLFKTGQKGGEGRGRPFSGGPTAALLSVCPSGRGWAENSKVLSSFRVPKRWPRLLLFRYVVTRSLFERVLPLSDTPAAVPGKRTLIRLLFCPPSPSPYRIPLLSISLARSASLAGQTDRRIRTMDKTFLAR